MGKGSSSNVASLAAVQPLPEPAVARTLSSDVQRAQEAQQQARSRYFGIGKLLTRNTDDATGSATLGGR